MSTFINDFKTNFEKNKLRIIVSSVMLILVLARNYALSPKIEIDPKIEPIKLSDEQIQKNYEYQKQQMWNYGTVSFVLLILIIFMKWINREKQPEINEVKDQKKVQ
ncbi:hypothetical protein pb186bvf_006784 [Paramecium bursaria]